MKKIYGPIKKKKKNKDERWNFETLQDTPYFISLKIIQLLC